MMHRFQPYLYPLSVLVPACSHAQTASAGGVVRDPSEALISHAKITLQNTQTGVTRETSTNDEGMFWFTTVSPGP